jgi:hypothetical protein
MSFKDQVIWITGASSGIGEAENQRNTNALMADGSLLGKMGSGQMHGMTPAKFTKKLLPKLAKRSTSEEEKW